MCQESERDRAFIFATIVTFAAQNGIIRLYLNIRYYWNQVKLNVNVCEDLSFNISIVRVEIYVFLDESV